MVYVLNVEGRPLMPTGRHGHVRRMLRDGKARVVRRCPFTIQLMCEGTSYTQPVHLGIDAGSKRIGVSAATEKEVLYEAEVELRNDIKELLSSRREARRARRNRKTRYRKPRFLNRTKAKRKGWLAPSLLSGWLAVAGIALDLFSGSKQFTELGGAFTGLILNLFMLWICNNIKSQAAAQA